MQSVQRGIAAGEINELDYRKLSSSLHTKPIPSLFELLSIVTVIYAGSKTCSL